MKSYEFGTTSDGKIVNAYIIENLNGIRVEFLNYGCILRQFWVPKSDDSYVNIVYGLDSVADYENDRCYFGALIGRSAGLIKNSQISIDGNSYQLDANYGSDYLNGSLSKKVFEAHDLPAKTLEEASKGIVFTYRSPDGEDGFPGNVDIKVTYLLDDNDVLHMTYEAVSDQDTILNLTNCSYFYLGADQTVSVNSKTFAAAADIADEYNVKKVTDNPVMDLRSPKNLDENTPEEGYFNHYYCLGEREYPAWTPDVAIKAEGRGITMEVRTTADSVRIFSGNTVGIAIEPQTLPCYAECTSNSGLVLKKNKTKTWKNSYKIIV